MSLLRGGIPVTTRRALELVERLTTDLADRGTSETIPELADFWAGVNADAGLTPAPVVTEAEGSVR